MATAARLRRLRELVQLDIDALPDRPSSPEQAVSDDDPPGGVSLEPPSPPHLDTASSKQSTYNSTDAFTKHATVVDERLHYPPVYIPGVGSSYNTNVTCHSSTPAQSITTQLPTTALRRGDLASARQHFTPIHALARYPYNFCKRNYMQDIASVFFDQGKFWEREWDLYYVWDVDVDTKPIILVLESQFQDLLSEINEQLDLSLRITDEQREESLVTQFPDHPQCLPRYLGRSCSREQYNNMVENAPSRDFRVAGEPTHSPLTESLLEDFKNLTEGLWAIQKAKNKAAKAKRQQYRLLKLKSATDQFKRAQRYLGLRPVVSTETVQPSAPEAIDCTRPVPFDFEKSVVFVCVDVESYERAHHKITEVGIATLDTRDLIGIAPGQDGIEWRKMIRARHFRIKEHAHLVNHEFVAGHPDRFDFGESTFVALKDAVSAIAACFRPPFGARPCSYQDEIATLMDDMDLGAKRNIIFLGHDTVTDVRYLQQLGFDAMSLENMIEPLDTATIYRVWKRDQQQTSLGKILYDFGITGYNLHNAGNDAVYTIQAMLAVCVREASIRGPELDKVRNQETAARVATALEDAQQKLRDEAEAWNHHEADGDGGAPVPMQCAPVPVQCSPVVSYYYSTPSPHNFGNGHGGRPGRGRGRGGPAESFRGSDYRPRDGRNQYSVNDNNNSDRAIDREHESYYILDRHNGSGGDYERGRGHGRDNFEHNNSFDHDIGSSEPQVKFYW